MSDTISERVPGQILQELEHVEKAIASLAQAIQDFEIVLTPCLTPVVPVEEAPRMGGAVAEGDKSMEMRSRIAEGLFASASRINQLRAEIDKLSGRAQC